MTIHITGDELCALIDSLLKSSDIALMKMMSSDDLWITIKEIKKGIYETVITNKIERFEQ